MCAPGIKLGWESLFYRFFTDSKLFLSNLEVVTKVAVAVVVLLLLVLLLLLQTKSSEKTFQGLFNSLSTCKCGINNIGLLSLTEKVERGGGSSD